MRNQNSWYRSSLTGNIEWITVVIVALLAIGTAYIFWLLIFGKPLVHTSPPDTFYGYECTDDCSGHQAGFEWAKKNGITNLDDCPRGNSSSFNEGCLAYADAVRE